MTPTATRAKVIDMLKAGAKHLEICATTGVSKDIVGAIAKRAGLQRHTRRPAPRLGHTPPPRTEDATHYRMPKALKPWPVWAVFGVDDGVRQQIRHDLEMRCPVCHGDGYTIVKGVMDACATCAARARVEAG